MNLRDSLNQFYYDLTVGDLRLLHGGTSATNGSLSYHSVMYLDIICYQFDSGACTVSTLAQTLCISKSAVTLKINDLVKQGLVCKTQSEQDKRIFYLSVSDEVAQRLRAYDRPFERATRAVEQQYSPAEIEAFCSVLQFYSAEFCKEMPHGAQ